MDVNFKYDNAPIDKGTGVYIESVVSEIPGGVLLKKSKNATANVTPGVIVAVDNAGDYIIATKSGERPDIRLVGVLGSYYDASEGDKMVRLITAGIVNFGAVLAANNDDFNVFNSTVAKALQSITFNPPVNLPTGGA